MAIGHGLTYPLKGIQVLWQPVTHVAEQRSVRPHGALPIKCAVASPSQMWAGAAEWQEHDLLVVRGALVGCFF